MYIATVPNRGSPPALLLREGYRLGGTVENRTLANLTKWPPQKVDLLRRLLRDEPLAPVDTLFEVVGDRGRISQTPITALKALAGMNGLTALKSGAILNLVATGQVQLGLCDERNLFELRHPDFPGERLVTCRNPELAKLRAHKRQALPAATVKELDRVRGMVARGRLRGRDAIGVRVGKVVNKYKVAKHGRLEIHDDRADLHLDDPRMAAEAALDGICVIRTSVPPERLSAVERAFRSLKTIDLTVRPIHQRLATRVRAHIFLCLLVYYVEWHMREAWRPRLLGDEDRAAKHTRDPVAAAKRSATALRKVHTKVLADGTPVHSVQTLRKDLSRIVRNVCHAPGAGPDAPTFEIVTTPTPSQQRAYDLLKTTVV